MASYKYLLEHCYILFIYQIFVTVTWMADLVIESTNPPLQLGPYVHLWENANATW
jgi:hypothetical protein